VDRLLFVVARSETDRYDSLKQAFGCDEHVEIIFDRRVGERRRRPGDPGVERRRAQRRVHDVAEEFARQGYAVVRRT
jgi:hypothetical protein